ncbi:acetyl-CoA acetyltransferase [Novosphingobium taihuense]|uniref:Acetyl-CoA C-acetyltransferase n=1 Tax=Novosphingobium taihuense TaxID=260085 RepID=A0A7W7A8J5_9SPHN|nr:acetyl-CoA acetyltransferase [Novosphingobium taihuense]MBB4612400.1 acetyl-CoA C-acetyltransferase [Novosphingobium taihuense]TWH88248.1 acetyl-CoA C-acetyltransferase [Novosphingobium taihuense]
MPMQVPDTTPVIVGVGQFVERIDAEDYVGLSFADLAARAAATALADTGAPADVAPQVSAVGSIRTFEESGAMQVPFGRADKMPLAVARRLGIRPRVAILEKVGGQSPLALLADLGDRIAAGESSAALLFGSEAISTVRHLVGNGEVRDWAEHDDAAGVEWIDKGMGFEGALSAASIAHGIRAPVTAYALCENARRHRLGLSREAYALEMGRLFAPFTEVAANNPYSAAAAKPMAAGEIATPGERNRMIADPYPLKLVSRDQVNQAAAIVLMSVKAAREAGVSEDKWVYLHGAALANEREILERPDIGGYPAANAAIASALASAGQEAAKIEAFDFYSCFPVPVFNAAIDGLGLAADDPRGLTVTGGLPYFGGAGNNYSMHAFASMVERMRADSGSYGLIGLNGGFQSKYGAAVLSTASRQWPSCETASVQAALDVAPVAVMAKQQDGTGRVTTYTVTYAKGIPEQGIVIGEHAHGGRFIATTRDAATLAAMLESDPLGRDVVIERGEKRADFRFA